MRFKGDTTFLTTVMILVAAGFLIFSSASMGLFARDGARFSDVAFSQGVLGLGGGVIAALIMYNLHYRILRKYAFYIFVGSVIATLLVFIPGIGFSYAGATRWVDLGIASFQPAELLKIGFIIYFAAWISGVKHKMRTWIWGFLPFMILMAIVGMLLLLQPDTDTFMLIGMTGAVMFFASGARWIHIAAGAAGGAGVLAIVATTRPYVMDRILTFLDPSQNALTSGYQIQQSLIAIGSGGLFGKGFGQSVQKFNFLPEPIGDSIFAVAAEEFGFVGSVILIFLFLFLAFRGFKIAINAPDAFSRSLVLGIVTMVVGQSFLNIGAMLGVVPLAGMPLLFISHGGTALALVLAQVGIVLNVSKHSRT